MTLINFKKKCKKAFHTRDSQAVSDPSTSRAQRCLTCQIGRDGVFSAWYGGRQDRALSLSLPRLLPLSLLLKSINRLSLSLFSFPSSCFTDFWIVDSFVKTELNCMKILQSSSLAKGKTLVKVRNRLEHFDFPLFTNSSSDLKITVSISGQTASGTEGT